MSFQYNRKQQKWIRNLITNRNSFINVLDVLEQSWPAGQLEVSTFQQKLIVYLNHEDQDTMDEVVIRIIEVCDLFKQLSQDGLIRTWGDLPVKDNTVVIGEKPKDSIPQFLPDLAVATELLKWAGQKVQIKEELHSLVQRGFSDPAVYQILTNRKILINSLIGFIILFIVAGAYFNQVLERKIDDLRQQMSTSRENNQKSLDSLNIRFQMLYDLNYKMATDTQQKAALKVVRDAVDRSINQINIRSRGLENRIEENQKILKSSDSVLRRLMID